MRSVVQSGLICLLLCGLVSTAYANEADPKPTKLDLPQSVREYLASKYFDECDPDDARIDKAVEVLEVPEIILTHIRANEWERGQLENFATNKLHLLVKPASGDTRSIVFRDGRKRSDRSLTPERERVLRRLYSEAAFSAPEADELIEARRKLDPAKVLEKSIAALDDKHNLDDETLKRARENMMAAKGEGIELAVALAALGVSEHPIANQWAGVWLISRMNAMDFDREDTELSVNDLQTMDARTFYENVLYATKARLEYPWGRKCEDADFLQQVLSPRGTGEPLQRWRRHFFEALAPELRELKEGDANKAVDLARAATYDFFQYEGDTTWEDFGMLTALAVHEGRCEDCSNVENCMLRAAGLPAAQAFTPWWGAGDGNHAWTVIPSIDGGKNGNGGKAVKVYLKTWDKLEDITGVNTEVMEVNVELDEGVSGEKAALCVWNHDEWRVVARSKIEGRNVTFKDVGRRRNFVLCVQADDSTDRLVTLIEGKQVDLANPAGTEAGKDAFECELEKACDLGEFQPDEEYTVYVHTSAGWQEVDSTRVSTGAISFTCDPQRLYRVIGAGINSRPFTAKAGSDGPVLTRY
ncbi:MAG: transglutaminase domain-containing protein [Planctomycetes bacterium]|nr:transglutaminase domain-containing protein [Planctomycetota bacterium]